MEIFPVLVLSLSFAIMLILGVPVAFSIIGSTTLTLCVFLPLDPALTTIAQRVASGLDSFVLLAIPLFILAGQFMNSPGIAGRLIRFAQNCIGWLPGGLSFVNITASMIFGAISGSAGAAASAVGGAMTARMTKAGYERAFCAATNLTASTTGLLIPPSNGLIVYSLAAGGLSIGSLFLAGYIPGILVGLSLMAAAFFYAKRRGYPTEARVGFREIAKSFFAAAPSLLLLFLVMGGIIAGWFTPTEAAGVAVLYSAILAVAIYRDIAWRDIPMVLLQAARTTSMVLVLIAASVAMSWLMAYIHLPQAISAALLSLSDNPIVILLIINLILLVVGTFMDMTPALLIFTPIFLPVVVPLGIDPIQFGMIMVLNLCIGLCTPPVGSLLFIGSSIAEVNVTEVVRPLLPLLAMMILVLLLVTFFPQLSLWLPSLFDL
ncbi:TRAP transporter large permease [Roseibacillus persicicus]|uniref:TRAP transporter large permease n=1 Tax=Roseibacillus persicicus TaxID=454148 RepID=UPI00398A7CAB